MNQAIQRINPSELSDPSGYGFTNVVVVPADKTLIFLSGQGGRDEQGQMGSFKVK